MEKDIKRRLERLDALVLVLYNNNRHITSVKMPKELAEEARKRGYSIGMLARLAVFVAITKPELLIEAVEETLRYAIKGEREV